MVEFMIVGSDLPNRNIDSDETLVQNLNYVNTNKKNINKGLNAKSGSGFSISIQVS